MTDQLVLSCLFYFLTFHTVDRSLGGQVSECVGFNIRWASALHSVALRNTFVHSCKWKSAPVELCHVTVHCLMLKTGFYFPPSVQTTVWWSHLPYV